MIIGRSLIGIIVMLMIMVVLAPLLSATTIVTLSAATELISGV